MAGQGTHHEIAVLDDAAFVVLLQSQQALLVSVLLIDVIHHNLAVYFDDDVISVGDDVLGPPGVIRNELFFDVGKAVEASGAPPVLWVLFIWAS